MKKYFHQKTNLKIRKSEIRIILNLKDWFKKSYEGEEKEKGLGPKIFLFEISFLLKKPLQGQLK